MRIESDSDLISYELYNKFVSLLNFSETEYSKINIKFLITKIKFKEQKIMYLIKNRPFFLQRKKLEKHNSEINNLKEEIARCYIELEKELGYLA